MILLLLIVYVSVSTVLRLLGHRWVFVLFWPIVGGLTAVAVVLGVAFAIGTLPFNYIVWRYDRHRAKIVRMRPRKDEGD